MKKILFSNATYKSGIDIVALILRLVLGSHLLINHGWGKLISFDERSEKFIQFMGLSSQMSLGLAVFAEFFCSFLLILGLFTRLALIPLMITMLVALKVMSWKLFGADNNELAFLFFTGFLSIFILGPGKYSIDAMILSKRRR